jgi:hypothetical protein
VTGPVPLTDPNVNGHLHYPNDVDRSLTYFSVYDSRDRVSESTLSPPPPSSLTDVHRCIGYRNPNWHGLPKSARLTYLSLYDTRDKY